jgi:uncharacterized protein YbjT (DUF2867 family)
MARVLVAGGTGALGSAVVSRLQATDHAVRVLSRRPAPPTLGERTEWAQGDTTSGSGLADALRDVDIVVNSTGDAQNTYGTDVLGVKTLAEASADANVRHFFHISIVGIDLIDFEYYQHKLSAEAAVRESRVPYSIQRVTQFHSLLDWVMQSAEETSEGCVLPIERTALFQLIDTRDAADYVLPRVLSAPAGALEDVGGPEVLRLDEIAESFFRARGIGHADFVDPSNGQLFPPKAVEGLRKGLGTVPKHRYGTITWADYVDERYGKAS